MLIAQPQQHMREKTMNTATHIHIFYTDASNGWCEQLRDEEGNQVGDGSYHYKKSDAVSSAKLEALPVHIFCRNGFLQKTA